MASLRHSCALFWMAVVVATTCGCTSLNPANTVQQIEVVALSGANQENVTELDVVFVYTQEALAILPGTAPEWFQKKAALRNTLGSDAAVVSLQVPPATTDTSVKMPATHGKAIRVLSFAKYQSTGGQQVGDLSDFACVTITLAPSNVRYSECP